MVTEELRKYVHKSITENRDATLIRRDLLSVGWTPQDIERVLHEYGLGITQQPTQKQKTPKLLIATLSLFVIALGATSIYLFTDRVNLENTNTQATRDFYTRLSESQIGFTDAQEIVFPDEQKFLTKKNELLNNGDTFVEANLRTMKLTMYTNGIAYDQIPILTKGKDRSWWETPTGNYSVLGKSLNGYSSIGNVWMPYSIQFYGNYLIHGWPHYDDGTPVAQGYSGGCIRLATEDAKTVFDFVSVGTPILVLEEESVHDFGILDTSQSKHVTLPNIDAKAFLVIDLASGETLLEKNASTPLPIASLTKLMTAVTAHEVIYLGRSIRVNEGMLASVFSPQQGSYYTGLDLLYPLLMQSSNDTANVLAGYIGASTFVKNMNIKALSLEMNDTTFADPSGISAENISTAYDLSKLLQYIYYKRPFIYDISKGITFTNVGLIKLGDTVNIENLQNFNEYASNPDLIGVKNGQTTAAKETLATVWNIHTQTGDVPVAIIVLGSENRKQATDQLLAWTKNNFEL